MGLCSPIPPGTRECEEDPSPHPPSTKWYQMIYRLEMSVCCREFPGSGGEENLQNNTFQGCFTTLRFKGCWFFSLSFTFTARFRKISAFWGFLQSNQVLPALLAICQDRKHSSSFWNTAHGGESMLTTLLTRICLRILPSVGVSPSQQYNRLQATWRTVEEHWIWPPPLIIPLFVTLFSSVSKHCPHQHIYLDQQVTPISNVPLAFCILVIEEPVFLVTAQFHSWMAHSSSCSQSKNNKEAILKWAIFPGYRVVTSC